MAHTSHQGQIAAMETDLDAQGWAVLPNLLTPDQCGTQAGQYEAPDLFRSRVVMARHGFGRGEYRYFAYPLPPVIAELRTMLYPALAPTANRWYAAMGLAPRFPASHAEFLARCHDEGQTKPTPLLLKYGAGDYNCLHQDLYGAHVFPLQVAILLNAPGNNAPACSPASPWCRCARVTGWCSPSINARWPARVAPIGSIYATG
jgi:hypothetical protein